MFPRKELNLKGSHENNYVLWTFLGITAVTVKEWWLRQRILLFLFFILWNECGIIHGSLLTSVNILLHDFRIPGQNPLAHTAERIAPRFCHWEVQFSLTETLPSSLASLKVYLNINEITIKLTLPPFRRSGFIHFSENSYTTTKLVCLLMAEVS